MTNGKDSRRDPRAKVLSMTVRYKSATVAEFIENHSYDVSRGGIFIKTPSPFPPGTLLKFEVRIAEEQKVMMGVGRVTWKRDVETGPDKPAGMGVKFIKLDDESTRLIGDLVDARESVESSFEEGARESGVKVSVPPPAAPTTASTTSPTTSPTTASNPDQSVIAHTADILRSTVDATRSHAKKSEAEEDDRATLPNSGPVSSLRKPSAPPRPQSKLPSPAPSAPQEEAAKSQPAPDSSAPSSEAGASTEAAAAVEAESEEKRSAKAESSSGTPDADVEKKPISELITTPPRRSQSTTPAPAPKTSPLLWVILVVGVLLAGYYMFIRKGQEPDGQLPDEVTPPASTEVAEVPAPPEPPVVSAPVETSGEASADATASAPAASEEAFPTATEEPPEPAESVEAKPAKPAPKPRPARPRAPTAPTAPAASNPPPTPAPRAPEAPPADPAPPPAVPPPAVPPPAAPPPAAPPPAAPPPAAPPPAAPAPTPTSG